MADHNGAGSRGEEDAPRDPTAPGAGTRRPPRGEPARPRLGDRHAHPAAPLREDARSVAALIP